MPRSRRARAGLLALALTMWMLVFGMPHAVQARSLAVEPPGDIYCRPNGFGTDQVTVHWKDTNSDSGDYKVYRQDINSNSWSELTTIAAADCENDKCAYVDPNASNNTVFRYYVEAVIGNDTAGSAVCREPLFVDDPNNNFRAFYRLVECPDINGKQVCTENINNGSGDNKHAAQMGATAQMYLQAYMALNFKDIATYGGGKPYPIDLLPCNNGCKGSAGIQIPPANLEGADYVPATGAGTPYEVFVVGHELFHQLEGAYGGTADPYYKWLIEGQARSNEDKTCIFTDPQCDLWDLGDLTYYEGQVRSYLGKPEQSLMEASYNAALWWTYILEQFGTSTDEPARGMDFMLKFWQRNEVNKNADNLKDGIDTLNDTLANDTSSPRRFKDIFQDFAVANYAKDYIQDPVPNELLKYNYIDEESYPGGSYGVVKKTLTGTLELDDSIFNLSSVQAWGARYFEVDPDPAVPVVNIEVEALPGTPHELYFHVLAIKNGDIADQWSGSGTSYAKSVSNAAEYDRIALVVAAMDQAVNFKYGFNLVDGLFILHPNAQFRAQAGEAANPKKVIIELTVIGEDQEPVPNLDTGTFSITVGGVQVNPPVNPGDEAIIASTYTAGQYWIVIRAPASPGCDPCDLTVAYDDYTDTEPDAIDYGPQPAVDNMIVIDRSGSMLGAKIEAAKDAAQLYVDAYDTGDRVGVVSFNTAANPEYNLNDWTPANRTAAQNAIENMAAPAGNTAIGAGLRAGNQALIDQATPNPAWAMVLLSDGQDTTNVTDDRLPKYLEEYNAAKDDGDQVPVIHVVAVGDDADGVQLEKLTAASGGLFQFLPEGAAAAEAGEINALSPGLAEIYRVFAEDVNDEQQIYAKQFKLPASGQPVINEILVEKGASQAIFVAQFVLNGATAPPSLFLREPGGAVNIAPTLSTLGHHVWRIPAPKEGKWTLTARGCAPCDYLVEASLISDLILEPFLGLPPEERIKGKPMPILALLADVAPVTGATMKATSARTGEIVNMFDDGLHGDGPANDGFYGGVILNTNQAGGYPVVIDASGESDFTGPFVRRARIAFFMADDGDDDKDRLPNWWEDSYPCMDRKTNDESKDPDHDGLPNSQEYFRKTNPCDWDTDDGGQGDGSEVSQTKNPLYAPDDGTVLRPTFKAWASVASVILRFSPLPDTAQVALFRGRSPTGEFDLVNADVDPNGEAVDSGLPNGQMVCYYLEITQGGAKAVTPVSCTTPMLDPNPPHGFVAVARTVMAAGTTDARRVRSAQVTLLLDASDIADEEENLPFEGDLIVPGAQESGVTEMRVSNHADFEGVNYQPYQASLLWTLAPREDGLATVFVQFRDGAGNESDVYAVSVRVDPSAPLPVDVYLPAIRR